MAARFPTESKVQLRTRKGHDRTWSCDKHDEPISFYCRKDKVTICQKCAIKDHSQKPCKLDDIEDVISERRRKLDETQKKIDETKKRLNRHASKIGSSETSASNHLQSVNDEVNATYDKKLTSLKGKERDEIRLINEEADEGIRIINEKRETRIKACKEEAEKRQKISKDIQAKLLSEIKAIDITVRKMIEDLKSKNQHEINTMDNLDSKIERIKQNDKTLLTEAPQVIASLDESLSSNVHQEVADYLHRIERAVQRVKFVEGEEGGEYYGRIDDNSKWEHVKSIDVPSVVNRPRVCGLISDDEICVLDDRDNALYATNISSEQTEKVNEGVRNMYVTSCAPVDSDVIVCGKWRVDCLGGSLDGCIYDRQWKVIRDITIPRNTSSIFTSVYVDADRNGMILAAQYGQSNIYVINPADGGSKQTLQLIMASRFPEEREETGQLRTRKGHDMTWSCDKHDEPIKFYCKDHTIPICHPCATLDHVQKQCKLKDIEDVIFEIRKTLEDTQTKIAATRERLNTLDCKIEPSETSSTNHLQSVNDEVNATYDRRLKSMRDKERDEIRLINKEADEEIRIINEKRETRIRACKKEAEKQQQISNDIHAKLLSEIKKIDMMIREKIKDLKTKNQHEINTMDNMDSKIERIKHNDKTLVNEAPQVIASLDESLSSNVRQEIADNLDQIEREVQGVRFVGGEVGGEHYERIDGYIGKWELVKSIDIPSMVNEPLVCGFISDDEICVLDMRDYAMYVTKISTKHIEKVTEKDRELCTASCVPVDSNVIVCGKWKKVRRGGSLDGFITLYDRQWRVIRDITIPKNKSSRDTGVIVDVDRGGMILAAPFGQSNIYVINPADGKIVNTITMKSKNKVCRIHALSSDDVIVRIDGMFIVISRSGEEKAVIHCDEWKDSRSYVDKLTDTLYITYCIDKERDMYAVDEVSCDGNIQAKRIVDYKRSDRSSLFSTCLVTPSGNLVACDGDKLRVYNKSLIL